MTAAFFGATAVLFGAFGAHGLKSLLSPESIDSYRTAVQYQMIHALALMGVFLIGRQELQKNLISIIYGCFSAGILLFSGSIYLLSTQSILNVQLSFLGPITPIGGLLLIAGWICLLIYSSKLKPLKITNLPD